jgi:hypothetical protein
MFCSDFSGGRKYWRTYCSKSTFCSAAVASPATARLALEGDVDLYKTGLQLMAGLHADLLTIATLHELGMPLSISAVKGAALSGRINVLQHLLSEQPSLTSTTLRYDISYYAAHSGSVDMLNWLRAEVGVRSITTRAKEQQQVVI